MTPPQGISVKISRDTADRQLGFLARHAGVSDCAVRSEELRLAQSQRTETGSSSREMFTGDAISFPFVDHTAVGKPCPAFGFVMEGNKLFPNKGDGKFFRSEETALRCGLYVSQSSMEQDGGSVRIQDWNGDVNEGSVSVGDGSNGDVNEDNVGDGVDDDDDDDELDDGDGEVDGLVTGDVENVNKNGNTSSSSVQSSSEKIRSDKPNAENHHSCFGANGLNRALVARCGNEMRESSGEQHSNCKGVNNCGKAITVVEPGPSCSQIFHGVDGAITTQKSLQGDCVHNFNSRREGSYPIYPGESVRAHLSDPITGILMDDAIILPCGHSFGNCGMQHVLRMKTCFNCSIPISEDSVRPNLALRAAVQAFLREEESHSSRTSKRRRDMFELDKYSYKDQHRMDSRSRGVQFPFSISDRVIIKGNKRTPERFVGRMAVVTTQCLNGWYVVKTLDNAESVKLQYRSLAKVSDDTSDTIGNNSVPSNWL